MDAPRVKIVAVLALKVERLERQLARAKTRQANWEKLARRQSEIIHHWGSIISDCNRCQNERRKRYGQTRRNKKSAGQAH